MITQDDLAYVYARDYPNGRFLVFVIDQECLYDTVVNPYGVELFTGNKEITDVSNEYPDHDGITVKIIKNDDSFEIFQTSEYFGSILLSDHTVVDASEYPYGWMVVSPNAKFDGEKFLIKDANIKDLSPWHIKDPRHPNNISE
jgi:hypothetical protein